MAIYRKDPMGTGESSDGESAGKTNNVEKDRLGRGIDHLTRDNTPAEKKPRVVRRGVYDGPRSIAKERAPLRDAPEVGGRVVIRTDTLPSEPLRSARSARKGTTVLVRTDRVDPPRRYKTNESISARRRYNVQPGEPIVINPRKKK